MNLDFEKINDIIWNNKKLEKALDKILIKYEDKVFDEWLKKELASLPESERNKKIEETEAFEFCGWMPMEWAKGDYCKNATLTLSSLIYEKFWDDKFGEDELVEELIAWCQENMMATMFELTVFDLSEED